MYKINGLFLNYGAGKQLLKKGDIIEWVHTCGLGRAVGNGGYAAFGE